jgi:hypothetical protein
LESLKDAEAAASGITIKESTLGRDDMANSWWMNLRLYSKDTTTTTRKPQDISPSGPISGEMKK